MFEDIEFELRESTTRGRLLTFAIINKGLNDLKWFFSDAYHYFDEQIRNAVREHGKVRVNARLEAEFESVIRTVDGPSPKKNAVYIHTRSVTVDCKTNLSEIYKNTIQTKILDKLNESTSIKELLIQVNSLNVNDIEVEFRESAFRMRMLTFAIMNNKYIDLKPFFDAAFPYFNVQIKDILEKHTMIKVNVSLEIELGKIVQTDDGQKTEKQTVYINTRSSVLDCGTDLAEFYKDTVEATIQQKYDDMIVRGSGFTLFAIKEMAVQVNKYEPLAGSSFIELSKFWKAKHAFVNVRNVDDNLCFMWSILARLHYKKIKKNPNRVINYMPYYGQLNIDGLVMPMKLCQIGIFEKQNPKISINVYHIDALTKRIYPIRLTKEYKRKHTNLLLITKADAADQTDGDEIENIGHVNDDGVKLHYCWIKNLGRAVTHQVSKNCRKIVLCDRCLCHFRDRRKLETHLIDCRRQNRSAIQMPEETSNQIKFKNYPKKLRVPFIVYADVEALLKPPSEETFSSKSSTRTMKEHEVFSVGFYFHCSYDERLSVYKSQRGPDCINWFAGELLLLAHKVRRILDNAIPIEMTTLDELNFASASKCHICEREFIPEDKRVRDHCHFTGKYRGAAHSECNILHRETREIPVIFHNLSGYDAHFIITTVANRFKGDISVIPNNSEKYISFTKVVANTSTNYKQRIRLKFIDSFRFMPSSLDYLSSLIPSDKKRILHSQWRLLCAEKLKMLERKGVFCYEYVDSWEKLDETALPPKEAFYSQLYGKKVSKKDYDFAEQVWNTFNIRTLGEYSDLYLKTDVLLLADVFENFRDTCINIYKLDPAHYYTSPGFSWDAMLLYTKVEIELLTDVDMLMFIERGTRGGIVQCCKRYIEANNKHMENFDHTKDSNYLFYIDANNLYGWSMMQNLPINGYKWCDAEQFNQQTIMNLHDAADTGYLFEVDLIVPEHLHDKFSDYPFCAENQLVPNSKTSKKLLLTLTDKTNYVIHYRMLKLALQQGLELKKIHRVLQFNQSEWLKPYIQLNTDMRTKAKNEFEKNQYKLMSNSVFGKTMENQRKRVDIKLKTYWNDNSRYGARACIANPKYKRHIIFNENLVAIEMHRTNIVMNKPIAIGMAILDISKWLMYNFFYNNLKPRYGQNVQLVYTDTDSFVLNVKTECIFADMKQDLSNYDTSDYPVNNKFGIERVNKKVPGLFKDEMKSKIISSFVGLRSKMYSFKVDGAKEKDEEEEEDEEEEGGGEEVKKVKEIKKAKGVKKCVLKNQITFENYVECLRNRRYIVKTQHTFRSKRHNVLTIAQDKIALSPFDDKRYILENNVDTLPWGHYKLNC